MSIRVQFRGAKEMAAKMRRIAQMQPRRVAAATFAEYAIELTEAKQRTPVDTGALRASGYLTEPAVNGKRIDLEIGFGGPAAPYAVYVHERLDVHHPVGEPKFLERTLLESAPHMAGRIAARASLTAA